MNLEIKNVTIKGHTKNYYKLNLNINKNKIIGVLSNDEEAINDFFLKVSGVNSIQGEILFRGYPVFDNEEYFKNRLLIDYNKSYITTLDKDYLKKYFYDYYNLEIDLSIFEKINKDLRLRNEYLIKDRYIFTKRGLNLVNYSLTRSINKNINIIKNTVTNCSKEEREAIFLGLTNKDVFNVNFLDLKDSLIFYPNIDTYIIFSNGSEAITLTSEDEVYVVGGEIVNSLIYSKAYDVSITNYDYTKEEIKAMKKRKMMVKKIKLKDVEKHIWNYY